MTYKDITDNVGNAAQIGSFVIALLAFLVAIYALRRNRLLQRETIASTIWREYEKIAMSFPEFYIPEEMSFDFVKRTLNGQRRNFQQYQWLVSFTLTACEEILTIYSAKPEWKATVKWQLVIHRAFIESEYFKQRGYLAALSPALRKLVHSLPELPSDRMSE